MASENYCADALGVPACFEFEGESYDVVPVNTTGVIGRLERFLKRQALDEAESLRPSPDELTDADGDRLTRTYLAAVRSVNELIGSGHFKYGNRGFYQGCSTEKGFEEAVFWCVRLQSPNFTRAVFERVKADDRSYARLIGVYEALNEGKKPTGTGTDTPTSPAPSAG